MLWRIPTKRIKIDTPFEAPFENKSKLLKRSHYRKKCRAKYKKRIFLYHHKKIWKNMLAFQGVSEIKFFIFTCRIIKKISWITQFVEKIENWEKKIQFKRLCAMLKQESFTHLLRWFQYWLWGGGANCLQSSTQHLFRIRIIAFSAL